MIFKACTRCREDFAARKTWGTPTVFVFGAAFVCLSHQSQQFAAQPCSPVPHIANALPRSRSGRRLDRKGALDYRTICAALSQLTDVQGQVIVLRFLKDLDVATVARIVGRSQSAVKRLQFRALASLRRIIESNYQRAPIPTGSNGSAVAVL